MLVEMNKPGGSAPYLVPVLQLNKINMTYTNILPGIFSIDPLDFNLNGNCTCNNCPCYLPYQAELLNYESDQILNGKETQYRIGIFNNAPWTGPQTLYPINLK